ncbi:hypothetical protein [Providencia sp. PROV129]|uniref:hypothetical protein n=1 Tax=Providencia sp. PROV129 TaxID=2949839 RepID=UPI0023499E68|nr:hypothetical protein [Providencia sp. PROV129]
MKLRYLVLWAFAAPIFAQSTAPVTTGTVYVNARIVTAPCLPQISLRSNKNALISITYKLEMNFKHCRKSGQQHTWVPFTLTLGMQKYVFSQPLPNNTFLLSFQANKAAQRLEINYD